MAMSPTRSIVPPGLFALLLAAFAGVTRADAQVVIFVNASHPGETENGSSWSTAFSNLQGALAVAAARSLTEDVQIWVAAGIYRPDGGHESSDGTLPVLGSQDRTATFTMYSRVQVLGGFSGSETAASQRNPASNITVLSGDLADDDSAGFQSNGENSYHVVSGDGVQNTGGLDGFFIQGGNADSNSGLGTDRGAGLYIPNGSSIQLNQLVFAGNSARNYGGACYIRGALSIRESRFHGNRCSGAGGGNSPAGGAIRHEPSGRLELVNCVFTGNQAAQAGAVSVENNTSHSLVNCSFSGNTATTASAASLWIEGSGSGGTTVSNCVFAGDTSNQGHRSIDSANGAGRPILDHSLVDNTESSFSGSTGNLIGVDPRFANPRGGDNTPGTADDDLSLQANSPCIDRARDSALPAGVYVDVLGHRRRYDDPAITNTGADITDMGAYEHAAPIHIPRLYVRQSATGANDGSSWVDAYSGDLGLKNALAQSAASPGAYSEIWVAAGTYTPAPEFGSRSASFQLQNNLVIYGGFAGNETSLAQRNTAANVTTLSGDLDHNDPHDPGRGDNSYHVVSATSVNSTAALDGVVVEGGYANGVIFGDRQLGGGIYVSAASPVFNGCLIRDNAAPGDPNSPGVGAGGGLAVRGASSPTFRGCSFLNNTSSTGVGGAAYITSGSSRFLDCRFASNSASAGGGAVHCGYDGGFNRTTPVFIRCEFTDNSARDSGAIESPLNVDVTLINCRFLGNHSQEGGVARTGPGGSFQAFGCLFVGNSATAVGACGVYAGGGGTSASFVNCTLVANTSAAGSGAIQLAHQPNLPPIDSVVIRNTILWGNVAGALQDQAAQIHPENATVTIDRSTVQGWTGGLGGDDNRGGSPQDDPAFLAQPLPGSGNYGDLRLSPGSSAIDSGRTQFVPSDTFDIDSDNNTTEQIELDLLGFPRFVDDPSASNTGAGSPPVDRGCYESQVNCTACPGTREWRSAVGGDYLYPGNWYPSVPGAGHDTLFDLPAAYDVIFPTSQQLFARSATFRRGDVLLDLNASTWNLTSTSYPPAIRVGSDSPTLASLTIFGGTVQAFSGLVGEELGSHGALHVTGPTTLFRVTNDISFGFFGRGEALVDAGARMVTRTAGVGDQPGSEGSSVRVTGQGTRWDVPFFLTINNGEVNVSDHATLTAGFGVFLFQNGVLSGDGTINADVVNFGNLRPGNSPGTLTINGGYEQVGVLPDLGASSGRLTVEIAGTPTSGLFDKLVVNGSASLGGLLHVPAGGYIPVRGEDYTIVRATGGVTNHFDVAFFPSIGPDQYLYASYPEVGGRVLLSVRDLTTPDPSLLPRPNSSVPGTPTAAALGDLDGDDLPDLAVTVTNGESDPGDILIFRNRGGTGADWQGFDDVGVIQIPAGIDPRGIVLADFDNANERLDIAVCNRGSNDVYVIRNIGGDTPFALGSITPVGLRPMGLCAFKADTDAAIDIATADSGSGSVTLLRGNNQGGMTFFSRIDDVPQEPDTVEPVNPSSDKPGSGAIHIVVGSRSAPSLTLLQNDGQGHFTALPPIPISAGAVQILCRDLNTDGQGDLLTANTDGTISVILHDAEQAPSALAYLPAVNLPVAPATLEGDGAISIAAFKADADADRDIAVAVRSGGVASVRFLRNDFADGNLAFTPTQTFGDEPNPVALVSGYVDDDNQAVQDLVTVGVGSGRPGGPFGGRSLGRVTPRLAAPPPGCRADFNGDSFLDFFDLDAFLACFEGQGCPPGKSADYNGDGFADFIDYDSFVADFEAGC